uniref:G-protein coupled receptors family 1 profile domain-containing protein n=1 Tax=Romanomermis culicivorax TaxID=13658 RepID=A0A915JVK9_ROMCU
MNSTSEYNILHSFDEILSTKPGRYITAALYFFPTLIGISSALIVIRAIVKFKEFNTFIFFIVANHCAVDVISLSSIGVYVGICHIRQSSLHQNLEKIMGFAIDFGWFTSSLFLIAFSLSRMIKLKFSKLAAKYLTRRVAIVISLSAIYMPCLCLTGNDIWLPETTGVDRIDEGGYGFIFS